jgi:hypothetical protein
MRNTQFYLLNFLRANLHSFLLIQSPIKEPDTMQKDNEAVEVIEKKEVPAVKQVGFLNFSALWKFLVENPIFLRRVLMQSNK